MRKVYYLNDDWKFSKTVLEQPSVFPEEWEDITIPHTWNNIDGQDGGSDYHRGQCYYAKDLGYPVVNEGDRIYLEFEGVASAAEVYLNHKQLIHHEGGYSTFRVDVTDHLKKDSANLLVVMADNSHQDHIYPQTADFTFYGGIYRDVKCVVVSESHFNMDYLGASGLSVSSKIEGDHAWVTAKTFVTNAQPTDLVAVTIYDEDDQVVAESYVNAEEEVAHELFVHQAHLWQGVDDPYLYRVIASLVRHNEVIDEVSCLLGIREFHVDPQKGFFLNGKSMPLRGVSRHQDKLGLGNALTEADHWEDAMLIKEIGANTVRLAHYQHSQAFYDICDILGFVVWAEIPFISAMNPEPAAHENAMSQMKELIVQNYNHPSICFWGISNEITISGDEASAVSNLRELNDLCHQLDDSRLTTMAQVAMLSMESEHNQITDIVAYNHYFGWYFGEVEENDQWFDKFHQAYPDRAIGISEYGCEANITIHTDTPGRGDYSEEYQAIYHEHLAQMIEDRPWLWATHNWNMFDFGADNRDEGGVLGRNNKGLVTLDRKIKKDAFYVYKAFWSDEPFVHIAGRRYTDRPYDKLTVKVYSNLPSVTLYANGKEIASQKGEKIFVFENVSLDEGTTHFTAVAGNQVDSVSFKQVTEANPHYVLADAVDMSGVQNWFDDIRTDQVQKDIDPTAYSVGDTIAAILENDQAADIVVDAARAITKALLKKGSIAMMKDRRVDELLRSLTPEVTDAMLIHLNSQLQEIKK